MARGTALFDTVAISGTAAEVRAGRTGCVVGRVWADGVRRPIAMGVAAPACAQYGGGVVDMSDGAVTFTGGTISNSTAVRVSPLRSPVVWHVLQMLMLYAACCA
jgi:hypothetical protein